MKESFLTQLADKVLDYVWDNGNGTECKLDTEEFKVDVFYFWVSGVVFYGEKSTPSSYDYPGDYDSWVNEVEIDTVFYNEVNNIREEDFSLTAEELAFFVDLLRD